MLIGWRRCNMASREPLSMMSGLAEPRALEVGDSGPAVERQPWLGRLGILDLRDIGLTEIMHADAKEPHRTPACLGPRQQSYGPGYDRLLVTRWRRSMAARDRREVVITDFDRDRPREERVARQPRCRVPGHAVDLLTNRSKVDQVMRERVLAARGLRIVMRLDGTIVDPGGELLEPVRKAANGLP